MRSFFPEYACLDVHPMGMAHRYGMNGKVSGQLAALMEIEGCVPILHGPAGCVFHYRRSMRTRLRPFWAMETTDMRDADVVFGGEEKLRAALEKAVKREPDLIAILSSCTADIVQDDIEGIVRDFQKTLGERPRPHFLTVRSTVFSHPDKSSFIQRVKERVHNDGKKPGALASTAQFAGCGFVEVMEALVEKIMEPQDKEPGTLNIESFGWGYGGREKLQAVVRLLARMGIRTNTLLPTASLEEIAAAPKAELNLARRKRWAERMKERFGTSYLHFPNLTEWYGIEGIRAFYDRIAGALGREKAAKAVLDEEEKEALPALREAREYLSRQTYGLITMAIGMIPEYIRVYEETYHMPLAFICLIQPSDYAEKSRLDEETLDKMRANVDRALQTSGSQAVFYENPSEAEIKRAIQKVDCLLGDSLEHYEKYGCPIVADYYDMRPLDMRDYARGLTELAGAVGRRRSKTHLLLSRIAYSKERYPLLDEENSLASREMWDRMWRLRG